MAEEGLPPREATIKSMGEIGGALVGIALVLSAVLLPMAFFGGSTGVIYRQFSVTIVAAMALSVVVALVLSPALTATMLKAGDHDPLERPGLFGRFNRWFEDMTGRYVNATGKVIARRALHFGVFGAITLVLGLLFWRLPTGFLPEEDQGIAMVVFSLPPGATEERSAKVRQAITDHFLQNEQNSVRKVMAVTGFSFFGTGQNTGMAFIDLLPFEERGKASQSASAVVGRAFGAFASLRDALVIPLTPPAISGLGQSNGFSFELRNSGNLSQTEFAALRDQLLDAARKDPKLAQVRSGLLPDAPQLRVTLDDTKLNVLGVAESDATSTLSTAWGGTYVDDFIDRGRVKKVYVEGDAGARMTPEDLARWQVRGTTSTTSISAMVPFSAISTTSWEKGPDTLSRFNGLPAYEIDGQAASGYSSGDAMREMEKLQAQLPAGTSYAWSGLSFQENQASGQAMGLYAISVLVVFLCLAALYESWSVPLAVLLVIPLGVIGAVLAVTLRGLDNNIYFQVGLLTTIGLSAKNAILIVEFAEAARRRGVPVLEAALNGAKVRLRPILMTSLAFIAGVFPLAVATGAGAQSRIAIGTAVLGGMFTATALAIFYVPMFFLAVAQLFHPAAPAASDPAASDHEDHA